jgi:hypothetical protein
MNADLVNVFKVLVLFMIVAARYHDRLRDFKFGDMKVPKPKKERMKKVMKFMKRTWRFWTPKYKVMRVQDDVKKILTDAQIRYRVNVPDDDIEFSFSGDDGQSYSFYLSTESKTHLRFYVTFSLDLYPEAYDRLCHLSQMFNDRIVDLNLRLNMEHGKISLFSSITLDYAQLRPELIEGRLHDINFYSADILWAFNKLLKTDEEAVFVFAELVERAQEKN